MTAVRVHRYDCGPGSMNTPSHRSAATTRSAWSKATRCRPATRPRTKKCENTAIPTMKRISHCAVGTVQPGGSAPRLAVPASQQRVRIAEAAHRDPDPLPQDPWSRYAAPQCAGRIDVPAPRSANVDGSLSRSKLDHPVRRRGRREHR